MLDSPGQHGNAARRRELGIAGCITKPCGQTELLDALLGVVGRNRSAERTALAPPRSFEEEVKALRILLAEDNVVNQKLASRLLEKSGHTVVAAGNGREALERLDAESFDLILMDVQMPDIDGFEATATIRKREKATGAHLPIIAMTAHAMQGDRELCLAAGMDGYVSKPINPGELLLAVRSTMEQTRAVSEKAVAE